MWEEDLDAWTNDLSFVGGYTLTIADAGEVVKTEPTDDDPEAWAAQGIYAESDSDGDEPARGSRRRERVHGV